MVKFIPFIIIRNLNLKEIDANDFFVDETKFFQGIFHLNSVRYRFSNGNYLIDETNEQVKWKTDRCLPFIFVYLRVSTLSMDFRIFFCRVI